MFHTTITLVDKTVALARLLLRRGANPNERATFRKQLSMAGNAERERVREFHKVTPIRFAMQCQEPEWINQAAIAALREHGGE